MASRSAWLPCLCLLFFFAGCGGTDAPSVERIEGERSTPVGVEAWTITGQRDGAQTRAVTTWTLADGESLHVELLFAYDPSPVLAEGHWLSDSGGGTVEAEAVRFVGGQGEGPSVGGVFVLNDGPEPRFRLRLPLSRIGEAIPAP